MMEHGSMAKRVENLLLFMPMVQRKYLYSFCSYKHCCFVVDIKERLEMIFHTAMVYTQQTQNNRL
jgi:hypothetical protein